MRHSGYTLLEVVAASALTGTVLVSSLSLLRESVDLSDRVDRSNLLETLCVSKLEETLNASAATFTPSDISGNFASLGFTTLRFRAIATDQAGAGGIADRLMAVTCTVWDDENGDAALSTGEPSITLATKVAKLALYTAEAGG